MKKALGVFLASVMVSSFAQASLSYYVTKGPQDNEFILATASLLDEAKRLIPQTIKDSFKKPIEVRFESLAKDGENAIGKLDWGVIKIDTKTIAEIRKGAKNATATNRTHKTYYREILATVIHETIHAYDKLNLHDPQEQAMIQYCKDRKETYQSNQPDPECKPWININKSYSQNPYFKLVAGFVDGDESWMKHRSPDTYELTSSYEAFPVNMEYFLMDRDFACRRPTMYRLFRSQFKHVPFADLNCDVPLTYVIPDYKGKNSPVKVLDPSRIYQVHYFMAGEGDAMMSGWGHAMIRLVMCAPERKVVGPDCLKDYDEHLVLSYRAFISGLQINTMKGLTGDYPSRLFIVPLSQVIEEYNKTEMRDIRSLPLNLTREEIRQFATRAIEVHWAYDGKYYFTSNNCATETLNLLRSAVWKTDYVSIATITPTGLEQDLVRAKLADNSAQANRLKAIEGGYLFDSYRDRYNLSFEVLKKYLRVTDKDFMEFLKRPANQRMMIYSKLQDMSGNDRRKTAAAAMLLENAAHRFIVAQIKDQLTQYVVKQTKKKEGADAMAVRQKEITEKLTGISDMFSQPASFLAGAEGYGLPSAQDWARIENISKSKQQAGVDIYEEVNTQVENLITENQMSEMKQIKRNVEFAMGFMKGF